MNPTWSNSHVWSGQQPNTGTNAPTNPTRRPHQPQPSGKNASRRGHQQSLSVTSNPCQESEYSISQPSQPGTLPQFTGFGSDFMSNTYNFDHSIDPNTHQNFAFDNLMTPEHSDNHVSEHTTPQEFIWEQQFITQDTAQPHTLGSQSNDLSSLSNIQSPPSDFKSSFPAFEQDPPKYISGSQLLSPQLTTPSPPAPAHRRPVQGSAIAIDMASKHSRGANAPKGSTNKPALTTEALNQSQSAINRMPISPVVIVSSHNRGDSPARTTFPRPRSSSKRGRESNLHEAFGEEEDRLSNHSPNKGSNDGSNSRLMPPDPFEADNYADDVDNRAGLGPSQRGNQHVSSINDLADQRKVNEKNAEVEDWLSKSETGSAAGDDPAESSSRRGRRRTDRPRAHSTGIKLDTMGLPVYSDKGIPGPGVLVDENTGDEYSEDDSASWSSSEPSTPVPESPPVSEERLNQNSNEQSHFPSVEDENIPPELQEPLPRQFYRRGPWQDPARGPIVATRDQPNSSNAAAWRFNEEAAKWESASRAATWGTRRRLSESEVSSIVDGSRVRHLSLAKRGRERGNSILNKARGLIPRRSNSNIKKGAESPPKENTSSRPEAPLHRESTSSINPVQRIPSFGKQKSPPLNTGSAIMAMTGNLAAVGHSGSFTAEPEQNAEGLMSPLQALRKHRSKSDVSKSNAKSSPGLADLMRGFGGPPMPTLASPMQEPHQTFKQEVPNDVNFDDDDDDTMEEAGIRMDLSIRAEHIIPNYEGFKIHARQLNPRLEPYLIDRLGQEQVRRYKKLVENKIKHKRAVLVQKKCPSGQYCFALGGEGTLLPPRVSAKDPDTTCAQFQITNPANADIDDAAFDEGIVTPALFPPGIPVPPVKRLPAGFECTLCFKVKKFQKPSDWTKHVHEDIQPFSCTFPNCNEPKSFKRKADWVRHENERHRRLEYWKCNVQECSHVCYRKDNFVQHLVREHKKTEPKVKTRGSGSSKAKPNPQSTWQEAQDNEVWRLVESCRHETPNKPRDEPCKFCGNVCSTWKKLSVHMGKHMEQIAMPVLELVNMKEVAPDTIISPIEQNYSQSSAIAPAPNMLGGVDPNALSPYAMSAQSTYQSSSAGQSPATMQPHPQMTHYAYDQGYYSHGMNTPIQGPLAQGEAFGNGTAYSTNATYATSGMPSSSQFASINTQLGPYPATMQTPVSAQSMQSAVPRSQPVNGYVSTQMPYSSDMHSYQQYTPTSGPGQFPSDHTHQLNTDQHYNIGAHPTANEYSYSAQMNDASSQYHHYT